MVLELHGDSQVHFRKKENIPASTAIKSLLMSEGRFDCRIAQQIVFLECMRRLMGDTAFDECNKQYEEELDGATKILNLCSSIFSNPYFRLTSQKSSSLYWIGTIGWFGYTPNVKMYEKLHPYGFLRGDHGLVCAGSDENEKLYVGYGSFYKNGPLCWDDLVKCFKDETLTISLPEKPVIDEEDKKASSQNGLWDVKVMERRHASELQQQNKNYIESCQNTNKYEEELEELQRDFWEGSASYFIDLELVKQFLRKINSPK